ncbi:DUF6062 family protein [Caldicellulosiruptoraceae bacterium PP1]
MDILYYEIVESFVPDKCIICMLKNKAMNKFFDDFLYESVNDYKLRDRIRKDWICSKHAKELESFSDVLAHAIIYSDLLKNFNDKQLTDYYYIKKKKENKREEKGKCIFCEQEEKFKDTYSKAFAEYFHESSEFRKSFAESGFLCIKHFRQIIKNTNSSSSQKELISILKLKIEQIVKHLESIKEKNDYRNIHLNYTPDETKAWHMAVEFVAGE